MRISTSTGTCGSVFWTQKMYYSCEQAIESIAKAGFDAIDLCFVAYGRKGLPMDAPDWRDWVKRQKENCDKHNLPVTQAHAHYYSVAESMKFTALDWEDNIGRIKRDIEAAGMCQVPWLVIHPDSVNDEAGIPGKNLWQVRRSVLSASANLPGEIWNRNCHREHGRPSGYWIWQTFWM